MEGLGILNIMNKTENLKIEFKFFSLESILMIAFSASYMYIETKTP
jgi:hypothetical protein